MPRERLVEPPGVVLPRPHPEPCPGGRVQIGLHAKPIVILNVNGYWSGLHNMIEDAHRTRHCGATGSHSELHAAGRQREFCLRPRHRQTDNDRAYDERCSTPRDPCATRGRRIS